MHNTETRIYAQMILLVLNKYIRAILVILYTKRYERKKNERGPERPDIYSASSEVFVMAY